MLYHHFSEPKNPNRVVILGAGGFLGQELVKALKKLAIPYMAVSTKDIDLTDLKNSQKLSSLIDAKDSVVMLSAITPDKGRDIDTFMRNLTMAQTVCAAIKDKAPNHFIYLSSDAVYPQEEAFVNEETKAAPADLYGIMHRTREIMLASTLSPEKLATLRLTITYGFADTHNSYGPNRFRRMAEKDKKITLFGAGEETRDHIFIQDAIQLIIEVLRHQSHGLLNLASGKSHSFMEAAEQVAKLYPHPIEIIATERKTPITHRHYDITQTLKAFPYMKWTSFSEGLKRVYEESRAEQKSQTTLESA